MNIRISNVLELSLIDDDVNNFVQLFGSLKDMVNIERDKPGFKQKGYHTIVITDEMVTFIESICETTGIITDRDELIEAEKQNNLQQA